MFDWNFKICLKNQIKSCEYSKKIKYLIKNLKKLKTIGNFQKNKSVKFGNPTDASSFLVGSSLTEFRKKIN